MQPASLGGTISPGGGTVRWHDSKETQLAARRFQQALDHHQRELTNLLNLRSEYSVLNEQMQVLPQSISHQIMVPVGSQAIFPAKLVKTNEITVLLGDNYFAKCSAHHARGIIGRRLDVIERKIAAAEKQVLELQLRVAHAREMASTQGVCEIMEPYPQDEDAAGSNGISVSAAAESTSDLDVEEERSNIEETEARLRFMFGDENEWVDDEDGSSSDGGDVQARDVDDDDEQVDSGVDARYLADFTASVQSRRAATNAASPPLHPSPIVTNPAQLYDMLFHPPPSQASVRSAHPSQTLHHPATLPPAPVPAVPSAASAPANAAFTGRIVEKTESVRVYPLSLSPCLTLPAGRSVGLCC
jgi:prefoldin alpha subunit